MVAEFVNNLQIPIQLNDVTLNCSFNPHSVVITNDILTNEEKYTIKETEEEMVLNPGEDIVMIEKISQISMNSSEKLLVGPVSSSIFVAAFCSSLQSKSISLLLLFFPSSSSLRSLPRGREPSISRGCHIS